MIHIIEGMRIRTDCLCPPIPVRDFDWAAVLDDYYDGMPDGNRGLCSLMGSGINENAAIKDLLEQLEDA